MHRDSHPAAVDHALVYRRLSSLTATLASIAERLERQHHDAHSRSVLPAVAPATSSFAPETAGTGRCGDHEDSRYLDATGEDRTLFVSEMQL